MLLFDIGANRGEVTDLAFDKGFMKVIACEAAPRIFKHLVSDRIYNRDVVPLRVAVSDKDNQRVSFYEANEDGLSTLNIDWLTADTMPYKGKAYRTIQANTITIDTLVSVYGVPDLIKIDVEGAEWNVLHGITKRYKTISLEWTFATLSEHEEQLDYLYKLGYREFAPQYIVNHLEEPTEWFKLKKSNAKQLLIWHQETSDDWIDGGWKVAGLRPTADVGMLWVR